MNTPKGAPVILIGANSLAARHIIHRLPAHQTLGIVRGKATDGQVSTQSYADVPQGLPLKGATIINCVGSQDGDRETLDQVNSCVPMRWAEAASRGGAAGFVQLSSFSVFGRAEVITSNTALLPIADYGRSKLAAEEGLAHYRSSDFKVAILRIPILISTERAGKLSQLLRLIVRSRLLPMPSLDVRRSMLSYAQLADAVADVVARPVSGIHTYADPEPFSYALVAERAALAGLRLRQVHIPRFVAQFAQKVAPQIGRRLFESSWLDPGINRLVEKGSPPALRDLIDTLLLQLARKPDASVR